MKKKILLLAVCFAALVGVLPIWAGGKADDSGKVKAIFIAMDAMDEYWLNIQNGAKAKAAELGNIDLTFNAPAGKNDPATQLQMVEDAITQKIQILLIAPNHADALVPGIEKAKKAGLKVIFVDSGANTEDYDSFLFTDNAAAARLAADTLAAQIGGSGKIAIINAQAGAGTTMTRENEFKDQIKTKYPNITVVGTQYSDGDRTRALNIATDFMTANPDLVGIYACNEGATIGAGNGIEQAGKAGKVKLVGFDSSADTTALIKRDVLQATMVQNPYKMGYQGLQLGVDVLQGKAVQKRFDTGVTVATKENVDSL
ncbi:periplasmic sugar-binding protein [Treponema primitia ZAS-2]|uniref:Periplasmic sugar-binding protein n=1 Tax=Treponema primitia (strain ATCC BAA-887 / DSM 12427 / ZAS-2) TaxID=545694 RepID=F5YLI0_TREPZ|nr:ABC transporter substrate-binding protein [Treponema primitia]AEF85478.1 periplasmic sugar-binding protein [Treponema primitia ZAS-2]